MALQLFAHNAKAYKAACTMLEKYGKAAIVHPTGTGKSYIAFKLIEDHPDAAVLWLSPSEYIFKTQTEELRRANPDFPLQNVRFYTYAKLMYADQDAMEEIASSRPEYIILDEFHRVGAACWGAETQKLLALCPAAKWLGLTATSVRYLDNNRDMAEELFEGYIASEMTLGEAIVRGILPAPAYVTTVFRYQKELAKYQSRVDALSSPGIQDINQKYLDALRRALEQADGLDRVFARHITDRQGKYIAFCADKAHMDEMLAHVPEWFAGIDAAPHVYSVYAEDAAASQVFDQFKQDDSAHLKLLFCIDMLNEGIHVKGVSGVILFRPTVSPIIYKQQIGRALTAGTQAVPLILDVVNNFDGLCSIAGLQEEMAAAVHRLYANGEGEQIVTERFEVTEQVQDCRRLFEALESSLASTWDHYFSAARIYQAEHGDLNVPLRYTTPSGLCLGGWIQTQRLLKAGKKAGGLTEQQIARLDSIGMVWKTRPERAWENGLEAARRYWQRFGDLQVPQGYRDENGFALGNWISYTRQKQMAGSLDPWQTEALDSIGMVWNSKDAQWEQAYAEALLYYREHGDLNIPAKYATPKGTLLGAWLANQRTAHRRGRLPQEKTARLEALGVEWNRNDRQWQRIYAVAEQYYRAHGDLNVPFEYVTPEGIRLGQWIVRQREQWNKPKAGRAKLSADRKARLDAIGMRWNEQDPWQHRYNLTLQYKQDYGNLNIPAKYKTADGIWLGNWLYRQKRMLQDTPEALTAGQREQLCVLLARAEQPVKDSA